MSSEPTPVSNELPASAARTFTLKATNNSSLEGASYFNVFPPALTNLPANAQLLTALVSDATAQKQSTTMTWRGGSEALSLFAVSDATPPITSGNIPVALADTVAIDWVDDAFTVVPAAGGSTGSIQVTFTAAVPSGTSIGLVVGPGSIQVKQPAGQSALTLTPDLSLVATVTFGTAFQLPLPLVSNETPPSLVTFREGASSAGPTATAEIVVDMYDEITTLT